MEMRIQKIISQAGLLSRRKAEEALLDGRITINGKITTEKGASADPSQDQIQLDGKRVTIESQKTLLILNKPRGYLTTKADPDHRKTVMELIPEQLRRSLHPVGRLDYYSEGLLLFTNDGAFGHHLSHPRFQVEKVYLVRIENRLSQKELKVLTEGTLLEDGFGKFEKIKILKTNSHSTLLSVTVTEGRNRFIRRMFDAIGHQVHRLKRVAQGPVRLGDLPSSHFRMISPSHFQQLRSILGIQ